MWREMGGKEGRSRGGTVNALTILQPYAGLICLPDDDHRVKRVENRRWKPPPKAVKRELAIHAGRSRALLDLDDVELAGLDLIFGAIVATAVLEGWFEVCAGEGLDSIPRTALEAWPWLPDHGQHVQGRFCWVLGQVRVLPAPVPCRGFLGLWPVTVPLP
jgi:hypothetical protein